MDSPYVGMWDLIYDTIRAFWALTEPRIEDAARAGNVPVELYYYAELGLRVFSREHFQKRDPFSNPAQFDRAFQKLAAEDWIVPGGQGKFVVTEKARDAAREIIRTGDAYLGTLELIAASDAERLKTLLLSIVDANRAAAEPPYKWAAVNRFRAADETSPLLAQIREALMDLFAYRDDAHMSAWHGYPVSGIAWSAFGMIWSNTAFTPEEIAAHAWFRGYEADDYRRALDELRGRGWINEAGQVTPVGKKLRDSVEQLTDAYFYSPWLVLGESQVQELRVRLIELRNHLANVST